MIFTHPFCARQAICFSSHKITFPFITIWLEHLYCIGKVIFLYNFSTRTRIAGGLLFRTLCVLNRLISLEFKKNTLIKECFFVNRQRPIFPGSFPPSIFSAKGLNFCVRDGNRCDPFAIVTGLRILSQFAKQIVARCHVRDSKTLVCKIFDAF